MGIIYIVSNCMECMGTGTITHNQGPNGPLVTEPCPSCAGTGKKKSNSSGIDSEVFDDILGKLNDLKEKVDEIKEKVDTL